MAANLTAKVLIADEVSQEGINILAEKLEVSYLPEISPEQLLKDIANYDAVLVRSRSKISKEVIAAGKKLKVIGRAGVGVDNIDVDAATERGILVINSPEGNTASAAEHTLAMMLSLARQVAAADHSVKQGLWERKHFIGTELFNKTLGVIGLGKIGSRVAQAALALGMKVIVFDPLVSPERAAALNFKSVSLDEIWANADFITVHTPKTRETANLINADVLSKVKPGVRIINCARGGIIDENALAEAIKAGRVAGAAIDVFDNEPPTDSPLLKFNSQVVLTPHLGASTFEAQFNVAIDLAEQIRDYILTGSARSPVNLPYMRPDVVKSLGKYLFLAEVMGAIAGELAEGGVKQVELVASGALSEKEITPLTIAALRGIFSRRMEGVTYVNAQLTARNHGIAVKETKLAEGQRYRDELAIIVSTDGSHAALSGTILAHDEAVITKINNYPINLTPSRYMLFTSHSDQPGMVAKVAGALGEQDINISTMTVARSGAREQAVMVMTLDDPLNQEQVRLLGKQSGIHMARFVALNNLI
jgi:D-3-phosphoglycerate dehydrogenase